MKRIAAVCILSALPTLVLAQATCEENLAEVDARIASGKYPDYNVQLAKTMRDSIAQLCDMGMANEQMLDQMMDGFEDVLPVKTEEERRAEREEKRKVAEASRAARKAEAIAREQARPDSGLDTVTGKGQSMGSAFVDRSEDMLNFWIWDWDVHKGSARVLYETLPSREQLARPDWQTYVYVVETRPDGSSTQHLITSKQAQENKALALRRGRDEILLQRGTGPDHTRTTLERWSISNRKIISSVPTPVVGVPPSDKINWMPFRGATSDGNIMFVGAYEPERGGPLTMAWYKASPDAGTLGSGTRPIESGGFEGLFMIPTKDGGGAFTQVFNADEEVVRQYSGSEVRATIGREMRILTIEGNATSSRLSAIHGRFVMPTKMDIAAMQYMTDLEHELMGNRSTETLNVGPHTVPMFQAVDDGYVILSELTGNRSRRDAIHGHWLIWVSSDKIEREVYLNPLAEDLNVDFVTMTVTDNDEIVLYGNSTEHAGADYAVLLDSQGKAKATAVVKQPKNGKIEGMIAGADGVWLFGHGYPTEQYSRFRFWAERIDF
ncbi:MAG: hypothetical protein ACR2QU_06310 [Gammaproteobacteria bacterium]